MDEMEREMWKYKKAYYQLDAQYRDLKAEVEQWRNLAKANGRALLMRYGIDPDKFNLDEKPDPPKPSEDKVPRYMKYDINKKPKCRYWNTDDKCEIWDNNRPPNACLACNSYTSPPKPSEDKDGV